MWWRGRKLVRSTGRSFSGKSTATEEARSLDRSQHRCSSIESLLSLEQSFVTYDRNNNVCIRDEIIIPKEVDNREDENRVIQNSVSNDVNHTDENPLSDTDDVNIGLDILESELENDAAEVDNLRSSQREGKYLPVDNCIDYTVSSEPLKCSKATNVNTRSSIMKKDIENSTIINGSGVVVGSTTSNICNTNSNSAAVRFGAVEVHGHELQLAECSVPLRGPPLGLGWNRVTYHKFQSVDDFFEEKCVVGNAPRSLLQPSQYRIDTLLELGYSRRDIQSAIREAGIARTKRIHSARYSSRNKCFVVVRTAVFDLFSCSTKDGDRKHQIIKEQANKKRAVSS